MENHIKNKVIIITGAASGFGRLTSIKAAALGAKIVCGDICASGLEQTVNVIRAAGGQATGIITNVKELGDMQALVRRAIETYGHVDVLVNNAGIMPLAYFSDHVQAMDKWNHCIDVNFKGVLNGIVAVYDTMIDQGFGHIVNLSSIYGNHPVAGAGVYGATKAAINYLSESLRIESHGKIKVTIVKPTGIPGTGLGSNVVNMEAAMGIMGHNAAIFLEKAKARAEGRPVESEQNPDSIQYSPLEPDLLTDQLIYAINQPWGVSIGEITIRASGDIFVV